MVRLFLVVGVLLGGSAAIAENARPEPLLTGLKNPESVAVGADGRIYITEIGDFNTDGDGRVLVIDQSGKAVPFATGLDDPKGMVYWQQFFYVTDKNRVWRIDEKGRPEVFAATKAFPNEPAFLNDIAVDEKGILYVSDSGDGKENVGGIFRIDPKGRVTVVADSKTIPGLKKPNGLVLDGMHHLLMLDFDAGTLLRVRIADGSATKIAEGFDGGDGLAWDHFGQLFITSWKTGKVWGIPRPGESPVLIASGFESAADCCLDPTGQAILVPDMKAGTLTAVPTTIPGWEVDASPLLIQGTPAFPSLEWTGWKAETDMGTLNPLRPLILTHAGDGSNRVFVGIQQGTVHVFPNDAKATRTKLFLDIEDRVFYSDKENEQGLLGLAFHPQYKSNGQFFVFYTLKKDKTVNVVSRFRVSKDDPNRAEPSSEEVLFSIKRPFWNHDGGTIAFGPDGYLYIALGDGGSANDPMKNGQNLNSLLGKILRIDVDRREGEKKYGIPGDNPFVGRQDAAPEIWAYGLRNPWRMAFDRKTGTLWAGDVGQNLYEEIVTIEKGGNYGWSVREGFHPFGVKGVDRREDIIEPVWEYHHDLGKSITGGGVYRGKQFPELEGHYLYGDYVSGVFYALKYDDVKKRVVANRPLRNMGGTLLSFGEDEQGEMYYMTPSVTGQGIFRLERVPTGE